MDITVGKFALSTEYVRSACWGCYIKNGEPQCKRSSRQHHYHDPFYNHCDCDENLDDDNDDDDERTSVICLISSFMAALLDVVVVLLLPLPATTVLRMGAFAIRADELP